MTVFAIATLQVAKENVEAVGRACLDGMSKAKAENGCLGYDILRSLSDPTKLLYLEQWESRAAFDAHLSGPNVANWSKAVEGKLLSVTIDVVTEEKIERL